MTGFAQERKYLKELKWRNLPWAKQSTDAEKMTLELDLSAKQQEQMKPIIAEQNRKREPNERNESK
jgi:hypothetical protein